MNNRLKHKVIVSVQAMPNEPLYKKECMTAMMQSVVKGGAGGLRVAGVRDVKIAKELFTVPVIGITKPDVLPKNWKELVYITPTIDDVTSLIKAGADVIAFDGTMRKRPDCTVADIIKYIKISKRISMADISNLEEGLECERLGADILSTTLAGYTNTSVLNGNTPDFDLLEKLVKNVKIPVILEGRIWTPDEVKKAFDLGAYAVVIGSSITRPQVITKRFVNYND